MSYIAADPASYKGKVVGNGQCVAFVKAASGAPASSLWKAGKKVLDADDKDLPTGIAIATFDANGDYPNNSSGNHAAILVARNGKTLTMWDQWSGHPVDKRDISDQPDSSNWSNDSSRFSIIEASRVLALKKEKDPSAENCSRLGTIPVSEYGKIGLPIATPSWAAKLTSLDYNGNPTAAVLDADPGVPLNGLGKFYGLEIAFAYPVVINESSFGGPIGEVSLFFVSRAGSSLHCELFDSDGQWVASQSHAYAPGQPTRIVINYDGIGRIRIARWPETVLDTVCARVLAPLG